MEQTKNNIIKIGDHQFKPYFTEEQIQGWIENISVKINQDYSESKGLHVIVILSGAFMFASDLVKKLTNVASVNFMKLSSYHNLNSTGNVKIILDLNRDIQGKDILIIEDIVDTGLTMNTLCRMLDTRKPASINICTMLLKPAAFERNSKNHTDYPPEGVKYVCQSIKDEFVIGYGLDLDQVARDLPCIYIKC